MAKKSSTVLFTILAGMLLYAAPTSASAETTVTGMKAGSKESRIHVKRYGKTIAHKKVYKHSVGARVHFNSRYNTDGYYAAVVPRKVTKKRMPLKVFRIDLNTGEATLVASKRIATHKRTFFPRVEDRDGDGNFEVALYSGQKRRRTQFLKAYTFQYSDNSSNKLKKYTSAFDASSFTVYRNIVQGPSEYCMQLWLRNDSSQPVHEWSYVEKLPSVKRTTSGVYRRRKGIVQPYTFQREIHPQEWNTNIVCGRGRVDTEATHTTLSIGEERIRVQHFRSGKPADVDGFTVPGFAGEYNLWIQGNNDTGNDAAFTVGAIMLYKGSGDERKLIYNTFHNWAWGQQPKGWSRERAPLETRCSAATPCYFDRNISLTNLGVNVPIAAGEYSAIFSCNINQPCEHRVNAGGGPLHGAALVYALPGVRVRAGIDIFDRREYPTQYYDEFTKWYTPNGHWVLIEW